MLVRRPALVLLTSAALALLAFSLVAAQVATGACPDIVTRALSAVNNVCTGQGRNSACYGNNLVNAQFISDQVTEPFNQVGDIAQLGLFRAIETSPLDEASGNWGVSLMNVQANLPGSLPGQNAVFMLVGGAQIESAVDPAAAFNTEANILVTASRLAAVHQDPSLESPAVFSVEAGSSVVADARTESVDFIRVTSGGLFGWIARPDLTEDSAVEGLPVYAPGVSFAPMQAFFLRTGLGGVTCDQAPSALIVQGPEDLTVQINANGANISLGSTIVLQTLSADDPKAAVKPAGLDTVNGVLQISVLDGQAIVDDGNGNPTIIPEGQQSQICLTDPENLGTDGQPNDQVVTDACGGWTEPQDIPEDERDQFGLFDDENLNYPVDVYTATPSNTPRYVPPTITPTPSATAVEPTATPWPTEGPTAAPTQVTGADLSISVEASLSPEYGQAAVSTSRTVAKRLLGEGGGQYYYFSLYITVTNNGPLTATGVQVSGVMPSGVEAEFYADQGGFDFQSNIWTIGDLAPGQSVMGGIDDAWAYLYCGESISATLTVSSTSVDPSPASTGYSVSADCTPVPTEEVTVMPA